MPLRRTRVGSIAAALVAALITALSACTALGITLGPLTGLLDQAVSIVIGGTP